MNYESGRTYPKKRETYVQLAEILGVNANHLHNENDEFLSYYVVIMRLSVDEAALHHQAVGELHGPQPVALI